jgi:hypothetical protein
MAEQTHNFDATQPPGKFHPATVKLDEPDLEQLVIENYRRLAARTSKLKFEVDPVAKHVAHSPLTPVSTFIVLPHIYAHGMPHWLIEIHFDEQQLRPIGIEVADHIVLGVTRYGNKKPDLDLSAYGASNSSVSRRHALLLPSYNTLSLVDLGSTNGTWVDGVRIDPRTPVPLKASTIVCLGALTFLIRVISTPSDLGFK